ncbi:MAG: AraC family transcriptional regulator [Bacteroidales bacterium]|nr:AraC family transcriptional regulator [Bacteroidales bacterium]
MIPYLKWRERLNEITPQDHRIGTDIMLIDDADNSRLDLALYSEPFKVDMTMAIIYEKGFVRAKINMVEYKIEAPSVVTIVNDSIFQPLEYSEDLKSKIIVMSREFSNSMFSNLTEIRSIPNSLYANSVFIMDNSNFVFDKYYDLLLNLVSSPKIKFKVEAARHMTLAMFYGYTFDEHGVDEKRNKSSRQEMLHSKFIDLLSRNFRTEREVKFYAEKLCVTPKYLSQVVSGLTGRTPSDYIEEFVVMESKALLNSTPMTIQQVSDELHFPSQSFFGKYFKRIVGMSPKEYRASTKN